MTTKNIKTMAKKVVVQTEEAQNKYMKNVEVTLTEKAVEKGKPYFGKAKGDKKTVTPATAENGKKLGYFK